MSGVTANGWPVLTKFTGAQFVAVGEGRPHDVVSRDLARVAAAFTYDFHTRVEPVTSCFGGRTPSQQAATNPYANASNHCSSTAWDLNGAQHPYEAAQRGPWRSGFTPVQVATIRALLAYYEVLQWGGDFDSPYRDAMHWQIRQANLSGNGPRVVSEADVARVARKVSDFWRQVQTSVGAKADGVAGPGTLAAVKAWQAGKGLIADGIFGPFSQAVAGWGVRSQIVHGVDVSEHQTVKDWQAVSPDALVAKAHEGLSYVDSAYPAHAAAAREAGIFRGAYHYVWPEYDAVACCTNFLTTAGLQDGETGVIDFEPYRSKSDEKDWPAWVCAWIDTYRAARGDYPDIYLNDDMARRLMAAATKEQAKTIRSCGLWKARYDSDPGDAHGWPGIVGWQYAGDVLDRNVFYGRPLHPVKPKKKPRLKVDGVAGRATVKELQRQLGTRADGTISSQPRAYRAELHAWTTVKFAHGKASGSSVVTALQAKVGAHQDGLFGPGTAEHLQRWLRKHGGAGLDVDGIPGPDTVRALQRALNRADFR